MKEYGVHITNVRGHEYIVGHYSDLKWAEESRDKKLKSGFLSDVFIVVREVSEWEELE